eukprot:gene16287-13954_t
MLRPVLPQRAARYPTHCLRRCVLEGCELPYQERIKILGVLIDEHLTWEAQAGAAAGKVYAATRAICRAQRHVRDADLELLAQQLGRTHLDHCLPVWAGGLQAAHETAGSAYNATARVGARQE